jgi:hypothetical protein
MNTPNNADKLSSHLFTISYSGRELSCFVRRRDNVLDVSIDDVTEARMIIEPDGTLRQISGNKVPESTLVFIKKQVLEDQEPLRE